ncbi:MAG: hypothetical protein A2Y03_08685 [Omnitrophica WOR_2 bacterium GWF2_38_59]|nr:MAG: hypothetical protein A2Y03_08685 [Omnitrophica WOR_2 bacterium GWF2_38_59]OGX50959.1 MAG: hypothetical protein A2267_00275 [Omnitrophica WOR_2 bacterium RIFOXYA12_FULL_38_10]OGX56754.1 MAG: hypothetical protein A2447_00930 [Omnitrophica WOR_2 bacterium RIFOXYC2_FULL_38_12]HBG62385.1 hypothetical protein [Candidatus Omnitrophota bacterium]
MRKLKGLFSGLALIVVVCMTAGCLPLFLGAAAGAGGLGYARGTLEQAFDRPVKDIYEASLAGLKERGLIVKDDEIENHLAKIYFEFEDGKNGTIVVKAFTEKSSKIIIRVGVFGDEARSNMILNAVLKNL